jgi:phenylacetate-coenzyme A ligase PaaK-like adenylate-forming protein
LLDKDAFHENPGDFVATSCRGENSIPFQSRGSTTLPLTVHHDVNSLLANIAFGERERDVLTKMFGRGLGYRELYLGMPGWTLEKVWSLYRDWTFLPVRPKRMVLSVAEPIEQIARKVNDFQPDLIVGIGSYIELLFRTVASRAIPMHRPRVILYGGDAMTSHGKQFIEEEFKIPVLSQYNAVECFKIGFSCEHRRGLHIHEDLCHLRIVDSRGENAPLGQPGEVVISNLVNHGTVLLNYRLGDVASISNQTCPCGRTLMSLSNLEGRVWDILCMPNGELLHPRLIWQVFRGRDDILRYQLIQYEPARFELKIFTKDIEIYRRQIPGIVTDLRAILGGSARIDSRFSAELAVTTGKFRSVISHCKQREMR